MSYSAFAEKGKPPTPAELAGVLANSLTHWNKLRELIAQNFPPLTEEWTFAGKHYGWSLRLKQTKRAILYMTPAEGFIRIGLALGEKAVQAALNSQLPARARSLIKDAPRYPEGRGIRWEIRTAQDLELALRLARIKMAH